jgi:hypothetical protein
MFMRRRVAVLGLATILAAGCPPETNLTAVWKSPSVTSVRFNKILVAAQAPDQARRRNIEAHLAKRIEHATPSYEVISEAEAKDTNAAKAKIAALGFDGAVIVRFVGTAQQQTYVPGTAYWGPAPYGSMWGYWGYGWGAVYDPGYLVTDTVVTLESNVYSVSRDELIWSSRSETISPSSIESLMNSVIEATVKEMKRQKVL